MKEKTTKKARRNVMLSRKILLKELSALLSQAGGEIDFYEETGITLCTGSQGGVNHSVRGVRQADNGSIIVYGGDEDESCGAEIYSFEEAIEDQSIETILWICEHAAK